MIHKTVAVIFVLFLSLRTRITKGITNGATLKYTSHGKVQLCRFAPLVRRCAMLNLMMRKQKASDRRTRRLQRGEEDSRLTAPKEFMGSMTSSPMQQSGSWSQKSLAKPREAPQSLSHDDGKTVGRGRSRKRSAVYNTLASYHDNFFRLLTEEYRLEEEEVLGRIKASLQDPIGLEAAGHALYDLFPERRGNLFNTEVYRLVKARDATTNYAPATKQANSSVSKSFPPNHQFGKNDVILLTFQRGGSGDFFDHFSLPTSDDAVSVEGRVLNVGPHYLDVALHRGGFEQAFGPAPNNKDGPRGDVNLRLRADRFFSDIPYKRMVGAINQITSIPNVRKEVTQGGSKETRGTTKPSILNDIGMDLLLRDVVLTTYAFADPFSLSYRDSDDSGIRDLAKIIAKPPMSSSPKLAQEFISFVQSKALKTKLPFNAPQLTAIEAALSRRLTLIQGPPGSGKTTVAATIGEGFVYQCRQISSNAKVLACAFSNVGADNLADALIRLNLKVIRIGAASAVSEHLWNYTLDAAIDKDPMVQRALRDAAAATSELTAIRHSQQQRRGGRKSGDIGAESERMVRNRATLTVENAIEASLIAATECLRKADVIVSTSVGAADPRLLAACGFDQDGNENNEGSDGITRTTAPDKLPPLSLPFVLVDEACQSLEPATLIPLTASNSCRSLVLLGDPCQLPPTVRSTNESRLSISLMERLASTMPEPVIVTAKADSMTKDETFLNTLQIKQARSLVQSWGPSREDSRHPSGYRKQFGGSVLLSIQYRMHPSIAAFPSAIFYDSLLSTPSFLASSRQFPPVLNRLLPRDKSETNSVRFLNVGGRCNERRGGTNNAAKTVYGESNSRFRVEAQTSYRNEAEAACIVDLIRQMLLCNDAPNDSFPTSIGIVTPYNGQVQLIKSMLANDDTLAELTQKLATPIEVKSVDGYQGRERDVIIFSGVRSNRSGNLGFLRDWRRMNVALTRARTALIVVGDLETLTEGDRHWAAFCKWCQGVSCVVESQALQSPS